MRARLKQFSVMNKLKKRALKVMFRCLNRISKISPRIGNFAVQDCLSASISLNVYCSANAFQY